MDADNKLNKFNSPNENMSKIITYDKNFKLENDNEDQESGGYIGCIFDSVNNDEFVIISKN
jgi:hypothetical protein